MKIEIKNISKSFTELVLDSVSINIRAGERWALLGPNGSGKSTLLKIILGTTPPTGGTVLYGGREFDNSVRKEIGFVSQGESLDTTLSVRLNLVFFGLYQGMSFKEAYRRTDYLLSSVEINARPEQPVEELSGGTRKKISILRSFMLDPRYVLMDEPLNNLDVHSRLWLSDLWARMSKEDKILIMASHDLTNIESLCDQIIILEKGKVLVAGNYRELLKKHLRGSVIECSIPERPLSEKQLRLINRYEGKVIGTQVFLFLDEKTAPEGILQEIESDVIMVRKPCVRDLYIKLTNGLHA